MVLAEYVEYCGMLAVDFKNFNRFQVEKGVDILSVLLDLSKEPGDCSRGPRDACGRS